MPWAVRGVSQRHSLATTRRPGAWRVQDDLPPGATLATAIATGSAAPGPAAASLPPEAAGIYEFVRGRPVVIAVPTAEACFQCTLVYNGWALEGDQSLQKKTCTATYGYTGDPRTATYGPGAG